MKHEYTIEEIVNHPEFIKWMTSDTDQGTYWHDYARQSPEHIKKLQYAIDLYNFKNDQNLSVDHHRINAQKDRLIRDIILKDRIHKIKRSSTVVVLMLAVFMSGWWFYTNKPFLQSTDDIVVQEIQDNEWTSIQNPSSGLMTVELPDQSYVFLDPGSEIAYNQNDFSKERTIHLAGSAFFMVEKLDHIPFIVQSDQFQTRVLGTEFYVSDKTQMEESFVKVTDGKVEVKSLVSTGKNDSLAILTRMESLHLNKQTKNIELRKVSINEMTGAQAAKQSMSYRNTPVSTIFKDLAKKFNVKIEYDKEVLQGCSITASFTDKQLDQALYIICKLLDASFRENQGQIEIYSKGCKN
ncbi:MAG TPA: FecR family protein [Membranihabitans sp.]|nr:FecR family protein [Membranihabitans sp.]